MHEKLLAMRTTVEISDEQRARLLDLAARRGDKGFSSVLEDAIEAYLNGERDREQRRRELLSLQGSLSEKEANKLSETVRELRANWR